MPTVKFYKSCYILGKSYAAGAFAVLSEIELRYMQKQRAGLVIPDESPLVPETEAPVIALKPKPRKKKADA